MSCHDFRACRWCNLPSLQFSDSHGCPGTWIEERCTVDKTWALGCKLCPWRGRDDVWGSTSARGVNLNKLKRHAVSEPHQLSVKHVVEHGDVGVED